MKSLKTVNDSDFVIEEHHYDFKYQERLTTKLDSKKDLFDRAALNEIVLWKLNRYPEFEDETINLINSIQNGEMDIDLTKLVLKNLLTTSGVQLPLASTILRFKNPEVYQIIDQRVYRILYGKVLKLPVFSKQLNPSSERIIDDLIDMYLRYLDDLRHAANNLNIPFYKADRVLYVADKEFNKDYKLSNY